MTRSNTIGVPRGWYWALFCFALFGWITFLNMVFNAVADHFTYRPHYSEVGCKQKVAYSEDWIPFKGEVHKACWLHIGDKFYEIGCAPEEK